jgi:hypothetical protein
MKLVIVHFVIKIIMIMKMKRMSKNESMEILFVKEVSKKKG